MRINTETYPVLKKLNGLTDMDFLPHQNNIIKKEIMLNWLVMNVDKNLYYITESLKLEV